MREGLNKLNEKNKKELRELLGQKKRGGGENSKATGKGQAQIVN